MEKLNKATILALEAHKEQKRKNGSPYIIHPFEVVAIAATMTKDEDVLVAAMLHDTVEDTNVTIQQIEKEFGSKVASLVASETEDKRVNVPPEQTWRIRKEESLLVLKNSKDINIKILWLSDKLSNLRSCYAEYQIVGTKLWQRFNQKDENQQYWYYSSVLTLLEDLKDTFAWQEYQSLINKVFKK